MSTSFPQCVWGWQQNIHQECKIWFQNISTWPTKSSDRRMIIISLASSLQKEQNSWPWQKWRTQVPEMEQFDLHGIWELDHRENPKQTNLTWTRHGRCWVPATLSLIVWKVSSRILLKSTQTCLGSQNRWFEFWVFNVFNQPTTGAWCSHVHGVLRWCKCAMKVKVQLTNWQGFWQEKRMICARPRIAFVVEKVKRFWWWR